MIFHVYPIDFIWTDEKLNFSTLFYWAMSEVNVNSQAIFEQINARQKSIISPKTKAVSQIGIAKYSAKH